MDIKKRDTQVAYFKEINKQLDPIGLTIYVGRIGPKMSNPGHYAFIVKKSKNVSFKTIVEAVNNKQDHPALVAYIYRQLCEESVFYRELTDVIHGLVTKAKKKWWEVWLDFITGVK